MKRLMFRGSALTIVAATIITAATLGGTAIRGRSGGKQASSPAAPAGALVVANADSLAADSAARQASARPESTIAKAPAVATAPAPVQPHAPAPITPIVPMGKSTLGDGATATRGDSVVTVSFDIERTRTRRPEKFEQIVRTTLPAIYGAAADSALARIPEGGIAKQGDLISELPTRGVRIPLASPWEIRVFPETRSGQGGPLVVRYRALLVSSGA